MRDRDIAARWLWLLPLAAAVIANLPSVSGELVWDDEFWNRQLAWFTSLATVLKPPAGIPDWPTGYFRPVTTLSYLLDARLYGAASVAGRHVSNIIFHAITTLGVWRLARRLLTGRPGEHAAVALATTVFAVHPIHTESVGWIGARVDILATMFLVASVLLALAWRDRPLAGRLVGRSVAALLLAPVAYAAALGSKEVAIAGLALVPLALLLAPPAGARAGDGNDKNNGPKGRAPGTWIPLAILFVAVTWGYLGLRREAVGAFEPQVIAGAPWYLTRAAAYYVMKLFVPWPQSNFVVWDMLPGMPASIGILLGAGALIATSVVFYARRDNAVPLLGLLWAGAALAPSFVLAVTTTRRAGCRALPLPAFGRHGARSRCARQRVLRHPLAATGDSRPEHRRRSLSRRQHRAQPGLEQQYQIMDGHHPAGDDAWPAVGRTRPGLLRPQ